MPDILLDERPACNTDSEPEMLVIHTPRLQQHAAWGEWAKGAVEFLRAHGWRVNRVGPDMHAIHPLMVQ